jgi:hypothetical protein
MRRRRPTYPLRQTPLEPTQNKILFVGNRMLTKCQIICKGIDTPNPMYKQTLDTRIKANKKRESSAL